jgi:type III secretory pathway component EscR
MMMDILSNGRHYLQKRERERERERDRKIKSQLQQQNKKKNLHSEKRFIDQPIFTF